MANDRTASDGTAWLRSLRRYVAFVASTNLVWEFVHMPLYTMWREGTAREIVFAAVHCTGGDVLIATSAVALSLFLLGRGWPAARAAYTRVAASTVALGVAYTIFSEWLNIVVRQSWAYSELMPVVPVLDIGLSPLGQWLIIPIAGFWWARPGRATSFARGSEPAVTDTRRR
jgi:hypothetical protein